MRDIQGYIFVVYGPRVMFAYLIVVERTVPSLVIVIEREGAGVAVVEAGTGTAGGAGVAAERGAGGAAAGRGSVVKIAKPRTKVCPLNSTTVRFRKKKKYPHHDR